MTVPKIPVRPPGVPPLKDRNGATQISVAQGPGGLPSVYALDRFGNVWSYAMSTQRWNMLSRIPMPYTEGDPVD